MFLNTFFKKRILKKFKEKLSKIKLKNSQKFSNLKTGFSKILNHDIKNIILAQNNCLKLLLENNEGLSDFQENIVQEIFSSNKFLLEIINNAIFLNKIDEITSTINFENVDIINQAKICLKNVQSFAKNKEQNIILNFENEKVNINADKNLIQKIISNLIVTSVVYGFEKSDIEIFIKENEKEISFCAKNKSIYMTKEKIKSIFEDNKPQDFNQLGAKINLNVARKLINAHKWDFILTSDKNNTSTMGFIVKK